jgi:hypothetical protein
VFSTIGGGGEGLNKLLQGKERRLCIFRLSSIYYTYSLCQAHSHHIRGHVYIVDKNHLFIRKFSYDGGGSLDAYFWVWMVIMDQISIKTPNPKCRLYWCLIEFMDWRYSQTPFRPLLWTSAPLTFSLVPPPPPLFPVWISTGVCIHTACKMGGGGSGASDRKTPAAKYLYWSIFKKSQHLGFGVLIDIWSMMVMDVEELEHQGESRPCSIKYQLLTTQAADWPPPPPTRNKGR